MKKSVFYGFFFVFLLLAILFRLTALDRRPMHHDEANQAVKFGNLLDTGLYAYDKQDHHGPSLYYLSLPIAGLYSKSTLASLDEKTLRLVPAIFGMGLLFLLLFVERKNRGKTLLFSGLFAALSPAMVYYSRFYIQETLLIFFVLGFLIFCWRYIQHPSYGWALAAGLFAGMMYVTKETCIILFGAAAVSVLSGLAFRVKTGAATMGSAKKLTGHACAALSVSVLISWVFYSSFFRNPSGLWDSLQSFGLYFAKASQPEWHVHPWYYYIKMLFFSKYGRGPVWSEALILVLAVLGCVAAFKKKGENESSASFLKYIFVYTLITGCVFSLIPYKTPWNLLPFYIGMILLAGGGGEYFLRPAKNHVLQWGKIFILFLGIVQLGVQSYRANFVFYADPQNPYVYAQTSEDFLNLIQRVGDIASVYPEGRDMQIKVITNLYDTWPLPWYLREFGRVGYWQDVEQAGSFEKTPLIITSMDQLDKLPSAVAQNYQSEFYGLRPEILLAVHIHKDVWDRFIETRK